MNSRIFKTKLDINFFDADPAGIVFFGNTFRYAHSAFEKFIASLGYNWDEFFRSEKSIFPIKHCECEYTQPLKPGRSCEVHCEVSKIGRTSFTMAYKIFSEEFLCANLKIVHVHVVDSVSMPLPPVLIERLTPYLKAN